MDQSEIVIRLSIATVAGLALGLDREFRGIAAGTRTHAIVALSSAMTTLSALLLYHELGGQNGAGIDPLRVVQGLAQAVGFVSAGVIFFAKGAVHNLTSAANIWLAAAVGIAAGAGQMFLVAAAVTIGAIVLTLIRFVEKSLPGTRKHKDG